MDDSLSSSSGLGLSGLISTATPIARPWVAQRGWTAESEGVEYARLHDCILAATLGRCSIGARHASWLPSFPLPYTSISTTRLPRNYSSPVKDTLPVGLDPVVAVVHVDHIAAH
jgi:hypothetical protein